MSDRPVFVVPTDGTPESNAVLAYAGSLAEARSADVHVLQIVRRAAALWQHPAAEIRQRARLRRVRTMLERRGVSMHIVTLRGSPARAVVTYARAISPALIVIGRGFGARTPWRTSSVSRRVSRMSPVPVLVLPEGLTYPMPITHVVAGVDDADRSRAVMQAAADVARQWGARVTFFRAIAGPREFVVTGGEAMRLLNQLHAESQAESRRLSDAARALGVPEPDAVVLTGPPYRGILRVVGMTDADAVIIGAEPRSRMAEVVRGSTVREVLRRTAVPVLIVPASRSAAGSALPDQVALNGSRPSRGLLRRAA